MKILVVDDEKLLVKGIKFNLENEGYQVECAYDGASAVELARTGNFDLIILDLMMPEIDGLEACVRIREFSSVPIIMLTARSEDTDKIIGFECGADDYITKPFAIEELLARIRAALRKRPSAPAEAPKLTCGALVMDTERHEVTVRGAPVELTRREFDLLHYLLENKEKVISRESLLDHVWGFDFAGETNAVDVYIRFLRSKIDEKFGVKIIHTVRGVGYVVREEDAS